ncbi:Carboxypeptidase N subunit 2 [Holothuria leucospilota]|uniref:Carboxypeptidase N subunit 2 n=1 Tax=Holothuria leucospilota TaxID=206669 RepID=A0A9Q1HJZ8_HOLLE|nr:Carboxypeptidase N subunit 2 [Holothuria leucospilota]
MKSNISSFPRLQAFNMVVKLIIMHTNLTNLQNGNITLPTFPNMTALVLYSNGIRVVNRALVRNNPSIQRLGLQRNRLTAIPVHALEELPDLRYLGLSDNNIVAIKAFAFRSNPFLEKLHLSSNKIQEIEEHAFSGLVHLGYLTLSRNFIEHFPFEETEYLPVLYKIDLRFNKIIMLSGKNKSVPASIQAIYLTYNYLQYLDDNILNILPNLKHLFVGDNQISQIGTLVYGKNSYNLISLSLNNNALTEIAVPFFRKLPNLETLNLAHNRLTVIPKEVFIGSPSLRLINLAGNQIHSVHMASFQGLRYIQRLDLTSNKLTGLPSSLFDSVEGNFDLLLRGNNLTCDCYINYIQEWLNKTYSIYVDGILCFIPEYGNHTILMSFEFDENCNFEATSVEIPTTNGTLTMTSSETLGKNVMPLYWGAGVTFFVAFTALLLVIIIRCVLKNNSVRDIS